MVIVFEVLVLRDQNELCGPPQHCMIAITMWSAADNEIMINMQSETIKTKVVHFSLLACLDLYPLVPRLFCIPMTLGDKGPGGTGQYSPPRASCSLLTSPHLNTIRKALQADTGMYFVSGKNPNF